MDLSFIITILEVGGVKDPFEKPIESENLYPQVCV